MQKRNQSGHQDPKNDLDPKKFLIFIELDEFIDDWNALHLNIDEDMFTLQIAIMTQPEAAPIIEGTGGLRKMRFAPIGWKKSKREAVRVCYAYFKEHALVLLVMAYDHREKDNLSPRDKAGIKQYLAKFEHHFTESLSNPSMKKIGHKTS
jgi:hypothetical protein